MSQKPLHPRTRAVHHGIRRSQYGEMAEALFMTQGFAYDSAEQAEARFIKTGPDEFIYARYGNPTSRMFEDRIADLEGTEDAFATASGMAAVNGALMCWAKPGDHVVSSKALFGSCLYVLDVLARFGVRISYVDGADLDQWRAAIQPDTKAVFFESVSNPTLEVVDIEGVAALAHEVGALVIVDNVFATPVYSRAVAQGADVVVYSSTKHIDGAGRCLGGVICGTRHFVREVAEPYLKHTGAAISPFNAWLMLNGMTTLDLRVRAQTETALALAQALQSTPGVAKVIYPGLPDHPQYDLVQRQMGAGGTMVAVDAGSKDAAFAAMNRMRIFQISNNLGDAKSIVTHPATTTHSRLSDEVRAELGITPGLLRLSVGLEDADDLIADLRQALA
ncbi:MULTISPECIES: O-succinylhomoserine sulfhydrylase [Paracoccus]|uniref:O-succinylhomoserine sulfhydrylase n=2 Tax=Paracoccus TaxID=265 RepID=A0A2D2C0H0_9RHOB|nr:MULTISPECIES: O-succinylhomoserine sulfhydrylase [Paracoccus]ATQ56015.1 O-succinylhomoserine sulfhydrylase [Paracoccus yeei]AWX93682.1 O-succinylhomoserine sulfhydrylase [Paracoccus mutanolyticus]AYF01920.1 O-acetylhomoserine sulfhydrylase [Paracoccus yeei]MBY0137427.1 O-succinylhomoserine sulfhydrylase [Paracoccus yeei]QEU09843.1 O-succinylhomoserine sulfhydrylase [Paracoccus yeei]